ncbi:hypothetical protein BDR03DRAFT_965700 [Suillus americanus]|nr:hypothetical protein BDR03DRAFT_965700 [Suillus americanus]
MNSFARCPPQAATSVSGILVVLCPALRTISNMFQRDNRLSDDADRWDRTDGTDRSGRIFELSGSLHFMMQYLIR